jgi:hypothetical protein
MQEPPYYYEYVTANCSSASQQASYKPPCEMALLALQALSPQMTVFGAFVGHYMSQAASPVEAEVVSCRCRNSFGFAG